jgi:hypothetical protein
MEPLFKPESIGNVLCPRIQMINERNITSPELNLQNSETERIKIMAKNMVK